MLTARPASLMTAIQGGGVTSWLMVDPSNEYSKYWDLLISAMLIITVFTMPLCFAFPTIDRALLAMNITIDVVFGLDIVKNFFTGFYDEVQLW